MVLDVKRTPLFGGPIFYEGETGLANLRRQFAADSGFQNYGTLRLDSFHQFLYPNTYFGWLSVVPRAGFRATYYDETRDLGKTIFTPNPNPFIPDFILPDPTLAEPIQKGGSVTRAVFNAGVESSFKISRTWEDAQSRGLGLDGLATCHAAVYEFFLGFQLELESSFHLAIRPVSTFHAAAAHRLPAIHHHRFDR